MSTEERQSFCQDIFLTDGDVDFQKGPLCGSRPHTPLRRLFDYCQRHFSLNVQRSLLLLFILLQMSFFTGYSVFQRARIEDDAERILRNTALLKAQQFETSMIAMRYQMRVIGNAILLNHTIRPEHAEPFLTRELQQDWLDAVVVFNAQGDFVASSSAFPFEQLLSSPTLAHRSFRESPLFEETRREETNDRLFYVHGNGTDKSHLSLAMYRAVRDAEGRYLGGVVGYLKSTTMGNLTQKMEDQGFDLGPGGVMALLDNTTGFMIARMGAGARSHSDNYEGSVRIKYATDTAIAHRYRSPFDGVSRLGVFLNINDRKRVLTVGLAESDVLYDWYIQTTALALAILAVAILQWQLLHYARVNFLQRERLTLESRRDPLTHLANRRYFDEWARKLRSRALRYQESLSVLCFDLDYFKKINDHYGHDGGDAVLKHVAHTLKGLLRESDIAARFGGEEFVVALPHTDLPGAIQVAERIRVSLAEQKIEFKGQLIGFTASFGVARVTPEEMKKREGIHATLTRADKALYRSKQDGRNRVTIANEV